MWLGGLQIVTSANLAPREGRRSSKGERNLPRCIVRLFRQYYPKLQGLGGMGCDFLLVFVLLC